MRNYTKQQLRPRRHAMCVLLAAISSACALEADDSAGPGLTASALYAPDGSSTWASGRPEKSQAFFRAPTARRQRWRFSRMAI